MVAKTVLRVLLWVGAGVGGLLAVGGGLVVVGGVGLGLSAWAADHRAAEAPAAQPPSDPYALHLAPWQRPDVAAPEVPAATRDAAGAEAFARYWVAAYEYSYLVDDPTLIEESSDAGCLHCTEAVDSLRVATEDDLHFVGTSLRVTSASTTSVSPADAPDTAVVHVAVDVGDSVLSSTSTYQDLGGLLQEDDLSLRWDRDHWLVTSLDGGPWTPTVVP